MEYKSMQQLFRDRDQRMTTAVARALETTVHVGAVDFVATDLESAVGAVLERTEAPREGGLPVHFSNAYCVALASVNHEYRDALNHHGLTFPDGTPVAWAMQSPFFGRHPDAEQIRGPGFFLSALAESERRGLRNYFFGASSDTIDKLTHRLKTMYPELIIVGACSPHFSDDISSLAQQLPADVNSSTVDLIWVALGTPKQDYVANALAQSTGATVLAVGAAFDFAAGTVDEAPQVLHGSGFEWLYRLCKEPRRLWRRYLFGNLLFMRAVFRHRHRPRGARPSHSPSVGESSRRAHSG
jgi:N-acetylglucosaminyldiphosphoundecaprenol N-acetyl-beta-D-mannosaminyltransferase